MVLAFDAPDINEDVVFDAIETSGSTYLVIGGGVRIVDVATDARVRCEFPALSESLWFATQPKLHNITTVASSIVSGSVCDCFRVALVAFDAVVDVANARGKRAVALSHLRLHPDERVAAVRIPLTPDGRGSTSLKISDRGLDAPALVSCTVVVTLLDGAVDVCRIALGGDGVLPRRAHDAERQLSGQRLTIDRARAVANAALHVRDRSLEHELARRMVTDALHIAAARAERESR